jgi:biopolymer transport protein ExbD
MAASSGSDSNGAIVGINVTPLVDIMLVLLIIFMVTAKLVVAPTTALPLDLPKASKGDAVQVIFSVSLLLDGRTLVNGQQVANDPGILPLARGFHAEHADGKAVIQADAHVFHERVIRVMALLSDADISQIAFADIVEAPAVPATP